MNYFYEKHFMNTQKEKQKNQNFPLLILWFYIFFPHALYQFSLYLQKGIIFMISITLIPNY